MTDLSALIARVEEGPAMTHDDKIVEAVATAEVRYDGYEDLLCLSRTMRERYLDRARAAITAFQAEAWQPVEVKALEWKEPEPNWWEAYSQTLRLGYEVSLRRDGTVRTRSNGDEKFLTFNGTIEEAKAAAQADYEARIKSAILPNPPASP